MRLSGSSGGPARSVEGPVKLVGARGPAAELPNLEREAVGALHWGGEAAIIAVLVGGGLHHQRYVADAVATLYGAVQAVTDCPGYRVPLQLQLNPVLLQQWQHNIQGLRREALPARVVSVVRIEEGGNTVVVEAAGRKGGEAEVGGGISGVDYYVDVHTD